MKIPRATRQKRRGLNVGFLGTPAIMLWKIANTRLGLRLGARLPRQKHLQERTRWVGIAAAPRLDR